MEISADGTVVVGSSRVFQGRHSIWTERMDMQTRAWIRSDRSGPNWSFLGAHWGFPVMARVVFGEYWRR